MFSRRPSGRQAAVVAVVLVVVAALTATVALQAKPTVSPSPSVRPTVAPTAQPAADWAALDLPPLTVPATLEPSAGDVAGIPATASFELASLTDEPVSQLADRLEVTPATSLGVVAATDGRSATVTPSRTLEPGETYRFALRSPDGTIEASWAFRVRGPVNILSTIPGDATSGVPQDTGIEVTFDQEGVADMADHFSIEPAVTGTFERHGRTQVFVPRSLEPATTYTVTIRAGLARTDSDLALLDDVVFRFETAGQVDPQPYLVFGREVLETGPTNRLDIALHAIRPWLETGQLPAPTSADVRVYRLPSLEAANDALEAFLGAPRWTEYSEPLMPTDGLRLIADFEAPLTVLRDNVVLLRLNVAYEPGWYIVELRGTRTAQAFLQITPVSAWVSVMDDQTVVWANDVVTHQALPGATVAVGSGPVFATTDAEGLAVGATPPALLPSAVGGEASASPVLRVTARDGSVVLVPFDVGPGYGAYRGEWWETYGSADETYWSLLYTDRGLYRRNDRIEVWGYIRDRVHDVVPQTIEVQLVSESGDAAVPPLVRTEVRPGVDGAFVASLLVDGLPHGNYSVQAVVDGRVVMSRWVQVTVIRKPPYQLRLETSHAAVITGTPVTITATATFFDGTPVASLPIEIGQDGTDGEQLETDAAGSASVRVRMTTTSHSYPDWRSSHARPDGPESAEIAGWATTVVFPSAYEVRATGTLDASTLRIDGTLAEVDLARVERELRRGWDGDASGAPVGDHDVQVSVTELVPIRRQVGQEYDFIEKVVRPVYEYDYERRDVRTLTAATGPDGRFSAAIDVPDQAHQYEITVQAVDEAGRHRQYTTWVQSSDLDEGTTGVEFLTDDDKSPFEQAYSIGEMVAWRMVDDGETLPSGGDNRYLYLIAQRGLRATAVTDTPRFRHRFAAQDAPGVFVMGVRFTGTTYAPKAGAWANLDTSDRSIHVQITADQPRYAPGDTARLTVRTTGPDGRPVPATVILQAVDEKLFAIDGASVPNPLEDLYSRVDSGIVRLTATHQLPTMVGPEGEGGDTTGGGDDRSDFRDLLLSRQLRTDATGTASASIALSDDLTSWHVVASAVTGDLRAGAGDLLLPVGLPFFVELTVADTYVVSDQPVVQIRAFGEALREGDPVEFTVSSPSLGLAATTIRGVAFEPARVALPALSLGSHSITARAVAPERIDAAGSPRSDGLTLEFDVVASRLTVVETTYGLLRDGLPAVPAGADVSVWTFSDAGRAKVLPVLLQLAADPGARLDRSVAQLVANELLVGAFDREASSLPAVGFDPSRYRLGSETDDEGNPVRYGVGLVPSGGVDPWLAARVAVLAPEALGIDAMENTLLGILEMPEAKRDLQIAALAGLASIGSPVLGDLQDASRRPDLTPTERIYLALGFEAVGDDATARQMERELLAEYGEALGPWVRLRFETTDDLADASALLAVVAAGIGDPLADGLADYVQANPAPDTVNSLELVAYAQRRLERTPAAPASFTYSVAGERSTVELAPGESFALRLPSEQSATLTAQALTGQIGVAVEARLPVDATGLRPHRDLSLTRAALAQPLAADRIVQVDLTATFADAAPDGCYEVTEQVPSGLAPIATWWDQWYNDTEIMWPSSVIGQEVRFCASNDATRGRTAHLRYLARVVNEGQFTWEPAVMQLPVAAELLGHTPSGKVTIGGH